MTPPDRLRSRTLGLVLFSASLLSAQEGTLDFDRLSVEEGLSHSQVWALEQDSRGFLWLGTSDGLNRFDGYDFKVYRNDPEDPESLSANEVMAVHEGRQGELWIGTRGGGLDRFLQGEERFVRYRHDPSDPGSLSHDAVWWILEDRRGRLWVGTDDGLDRFDPAAGSFTRFQHDPDVPGSLSGRVARVVFEDREGHLWIGTEQGLNRFDPEAESFVRYVHDPADPRSLGTGRILGLQEDRDGDLWIGTLEGLYRFDRDEGSFTRELDDPAALGSKPIHSLYVDEADTVWIGTRGDGLYRFEKASGDLFVSMNHPSEPRSLSNDSVTSFLEDETGLLWIGTYGGVNKYNPREAQFVTYRSRPGHPASLADENVAAIYEDRFGELWVGNYNSGLNRFDRERRTVRRYEPDPEDPESLRDGTVTAVLEDRSGELWVGTWGGLHRFDRDRERFLRYLHDPDDPASLGDDVVLSLLEDHAGRLWVGTFEGLDHLDRDRRRFTRYPESADDPEALGQDAFYAMVEDRHGVLWFGSDGTGLYRFEDGASERFTVFRHDPESPGTLPGDRVASLYEDRAGRLWIGLRGNGLCRFDEDRRSFVSFRKKDGLASDTVLSILEDDAGRLWLATTNGLTRFDPDKETYQHFSSEHGLQGDLFSIYGAYKSESGEMFFGGPRGFDAFDPERVTTEPAPPRVVLTGFQLFNRTVPLARVDPASPLERSILETRELVLTHRHYVFSFEFSALHYASPHRNRYAYRLEGFDPDWIETDAKKRFAPYSNLDPGTYTFRVKAANGDGVWSEEEASVRLTVLPAPWKSQGAYTLYFLGLSAIVLLFLRAQRKKFEKERAVNRHLREVDKLKGELIRELEAKNAELERFTYTVSHDLKSPLVTIKGFLGLVRKGIAREDRARLESDLDRIAAAADQMGRLLDDLLELSRIGRGIRPSEAVPISDLAHEAVRHVAGSLAERGVEVRVADGLPTVSADRLRLLQVLQNLIENAVKFMGPQKTPRIDVGMREDGSGRVFYVRDNGQGIDPQYHEQVFGLFNRLAADEDGTGIGLALVRRIVEVHGGRIWVESEGRGHGSTFCFTLPSEITQG